MNPKPILWLITAIFLVHFYPAEAQQPKKVPRIGYLSAFTPSAGGPLLDAFRQGLREFGYVEGQNIFIDYRWAEGRPERFSALADELDKLREDAIVTQSNAGAGALQQATRSIPIVVIAMGDPVASGFVASLARPGGNITGFSNQAEELAGKWLELLTETAPRISRVGVLAVSETLAHRTFWEEIQFSARPLKVTLQRQEIAVPEEIEHTFDSLIKSGAQAVIVLPHAVTFAHRVQIVGLAAKNQLPGMYSDRLYTQDGGLMSYGTDLVELHQRAATYVDKLLKGAKPADLPVEQPKKFILSINLKTAKQIGITIPPNVLARADKVIK